MSAEYGWDDSTKGTISSVFLLGYMLTNLGGGYLSTHYRPKNVLGAGVIVWSIFTIATPAAAASGSLPLLLACRMLMGAGEGVTFPCIQSLVSRNVPTTTKSTALTVVYSGAQAGTIASLATAPAIIDALSWPAVFYVFGSLGFIWMLGWVPLVRDNGEKAASASVAEPLPPPTRSAPSAASTGPQGDVEARRAAIEALAQKPSFDADLAGADFVTRGGLASTSARAEPAESASEAFPWRQVLRNRPFWAIVATHSAFGFGHHMVGAWLPSYYFQEYGLDVRSSAWLSAIPYIVTIVVMTSGGWLADKLANDGTLSRVNVRKLFQTLAGVGPAGCLLYLAAAADHSVESLSVAGAVALMTAMFALGGFSGAGFGSNHQDLSQKYSGMLFGITSTASSACGCLSTYVAGVLLDRTHSWATIFELSALVYIASTFAYVAWASADEQFGSRRRSGGEARDLVPVVMQKERGD